MVFGRKVKSMENKSVFMIGMPSSGKTTYLVSLCRLLVWGEQETVWTLDKKEMPEGYENIIELMKQLNSYQILNRTLNPVPYHLQFPLFNNQQQQIQFVIPDLSGEVFRDLVYDRRIKYQILKQMEDADVLLFFINVATMVEEVRIGIQDKSAIKRLEEEHGISEQKEPEGAELLDEKLNNQSAVVELLQCVDHLVKRPLKIKFIISAWDLVEKEYKEQSMNPEGCIEEKLPLLYQYISSFDSRKISYEYWGVSAQGGDFEDDDEVLMLKSRNEDDLAYLVDCNMMISKDLTKLL